jgi:hypothetical protein
MSKRKAFVLGFVGSVIATTIVILNEDKKIKERKAFWHTQNTKHWQITN